MILNYHPRSSSKKTPKDRLNITKTHGLGSGIYGLTKKDNKNRKDEIVTELKIQNPFIVKNNDMDGLLTNLSVNLIEAVEQIIKYNNIPEDSHMSIYSSITIFIQIVFI